MRSTFRLALAPTRFARLAIAVGCTFAALLVAVPSAHSATIWNKTYLDTTGDPNHGGNPWYWFDDYTAPDGSVESPFNTVSPPGGAGNANSNWNDGHRSTDYGINYGYNIALEGTNTGEGVIFDPDTDPYKTGQPAVGSVGNFGTTYGTGAGQVTLTSPFLGITRLYLTTTQSAFGTGPNPTQLQNKLTIKSGVLEILQQIRVGRFTPLGSTSEATIVQTGGKLVLIDNQHTGSEFQLGDGDQITDDAGLPVTITRGIYDYRGGTAEIALNSTSANPAGIRLGSSSTRNPNNKNMRREGLVIINPDDTSAGAGYIRMRDYVSGYGNNGDGVNSNVQYTKATTRFHYQNAGSGWDGTRAIQVLDDLSIRNTDPTVNPTWGDLAIGSSRLDVVLDEAPTVDGSFGGFKIPINMALFDVDFDNDNPGSTDTDIITGDGSDGPDQFYAASFFDSLPANHLTDVDSIAEDDGVDLVTGLFEGGDIVSATIGGETYRWKIYYSGNITWSDANSSTINNPGFGPSGGQITGSGTGKDVVLIGYNSTIAASLASDGDYDDDNDVDADDIDILWHIVRQTGTDPNSNDTADLNGDSFVNEDDVDYMLANLLDAGTNMRYGDANLSGGTPELTDYNRWRTGTGGWAGGDFDGSGGVPELNDYNLWRTGPTQFPGSVGSHGSGGGPGAPLVPEPATLVLMGLGLPVLVLVARRRRRGENEGRGGAGWPLPDSGRENG